MSTASTSARSGSGGNGKPVGPPGYGGSSGSRKSKGERVNLDHLLNFTMPPRELTRGPGNGVPRRSRRGNWASNSKEKYVNSQFRFVMKPTENYAAHFADPDLSFSWSNILQVLVPTISALSIAQGDEPAWSSSSAALGVGPSRGGGQGGRDRSDDAERRLRKEKEKEGLTCPICLDKPVAGRMTRCGHIFCFPCILHYFQLSDLPRSAKCPICGDTIEAKLLKSIKWWDGEADSLDSSDSQETPLASHRPLLPLDHQDHQHDSVLGELSEFDSASQSSPHRLRMRLIYRPHITTLALPRSATWPSDALPQHQAPWHFLPDVMSFSKFMLATAEYMVEELQRDLAELDKELRNLGQDELGKTFVEAAVRQVLAQMDKARSELDSPPIRRSEREARSAMDSAERARRVQDERELDRQDKAMERARQEKQIAALALTEEETNGAAATPEMAALSDIPLEYLEAIGQAGLATSNLALPRPVVDALADPPDYSIATSSASIAPRSKQRKTVTTTPRSFSADDPSYLYYQAASGAHIYLHPLDIKMLISHFKSYSAFPEHITVRPEGADGGSINDDLRRRCKYLAHLPVGTDVVFMEADLEDIVGSALVETFDQALKQRRSRRRDKVKKDDRAKARWEAKEREKLPLGLRNIPPPSGDIDEEFLAALQRSTLEIHGQDGFSTSPSTSFLSTTSHAPGLSASASNSRISPAQGDFVSTPSSSTSPGYGIWGSSGRSFASALHATSPSMRNGLEARQQEADPGVDEAWLAFERSAAAFVQDKGKGRDSSLLKTEDPAADTGAVNGGKNGKKKAKKIVLNMSGGGGRRG